MTFIPEGGICVALTAMPHKIFPLILRADLDGRLKCKHLEWRLKVDLNGRLVSKLRVYRMCMLPGYPLMLFLFLWHGSIFRGLIH